MAKGFSASGNNIEELLKSLDSEISRLKVSPKSVDVTFLTPQGKDASIGEISAIMERLSILLADAELNFETAHHQYDDLCVDIAY